MTDHSPITSFSCLPNPCLDKRSMREEFAEELLGEGDYGADGGSAAESDEQNALLLSIIL